MPEISAIKLSATDVLLLQAISRKTFSETFAEFNTEHDMLNYLEHNLSEEKLLKELNNPESEFYLAFFNNKTAAYLKINYGKAQTEKKLEKSLEIERIYVLKEFQRMEIGRALLNKAIDLARSKHLSAVWLGVWEKNQKAISFYEKNGFHGFGKHLFTLGSDKQTDLLMKFNL